MKRTNKTLSIIAAAAFGLTVLNSCIEETEPTTVATVDQISNSSSAADAMAMAMPAYFNKVWDEDRHFSFGYGAQMHIRDVMTGDMSKNLLSGYNWFTNWTVDKYMGDGWIYGQFTWNYYYGFILTANTTVGGINPESATAGQLGFLGAGYAFRAMLYLDMARMYEFLPNEIFPDGKNSDGNVVTNLTIPIVKAEMTKEEATNNPRATREEMAEFIESDLNKAEEYIPNLTTTNGKTLPDLACVYGLKARLYMWLENYPKAQEYARKAINASKVGPMTEEQALNTTTGFNVVDPWMWGAQQTKEDGAVQTGIINWTSWASSETTFGYCGTATGQYSIIDRSMYERIGDSDWRKLMFKAPAGSPLAGMVRYINPSYATSESVPNYTMVKFRPANGNAADHTVGASSAYPIMRVEEMYFIEAEAAAHQNPTQGQQLINDFMTQYRDPLYKTNKTGDALIEEIVFQKRVELIGEGQTFFDIKRLNYSVTRGYKGTNWEQDARFNTNGRPAWMNFVMVRTERNNNPAVNGWNNPDPSDKYTPWTED